MHERARMIAVVSLGLFGGGCATTSPTEAPDVAMMSYRLPETVAVASGALTVEKCERSGITLSSSLVLSAEGRPTGPEVELTAAQLDSFRFRRSVKITRHPNGTLATINTEVEDRLPAIIGSVLKTAVQLIPLVVADDRSLPCNPATLTALNRIDAINRSITALRERLSAGTGDAQDIGRRVDALLAERAALRQNRLSAAFSEELPATGGPAEIQIGEVLQRFLAPNQRAGVALRVAPPASAPAGVAYACPGGANLCLPAPNLPSATWHVAVVAEGEELASGELTAPMPQWAAPAELPLRVAFGGNRSFAATYDLYGRQTEASWGSAARGATIAEALPGYAESVAGIVGEIEGPTALERDKAEIEELELRQRLNRLRACREILEAGGSQCPAEATAGNQ